MKKSILVFTFLAVSCFATNFPPVDTAQIGWLNVTQKAAVAAATDTGTSFYKQKANGIMVKDTNHYYNKARTDSLAKARITDSLNKIRDSLANKLPLHDPSDSCKGGAVRADSAAKVAHNYVIDSSKNSHRSDTASKSHFSDSSTNCHKADTAWKAKFADSSTNTHKADTSANAKRADTSYKSGLSDSSKTVYHGVVLDSAKRSGTCAVADAWTHGVTTNYVPYANAATTMVASPIKICSTTTAVQIFKGDGTTNVLTVDTTNSRVGIGLIPAQSFDVLGDILLGADYPTPSARTNNTIKVSRLLFPSYNNTEKNVVGFTSAQTVATNNIYFGGGSTIHNACTDIHFYRASAVNTLTGTYALQLNNVGTYFYKTDGTTFVLTVDVVNGRVGIGPTLASYLLDAQSATADCRINSTNYALLRINNTGGNFWLGRNGSVGTELLGTGGLAYSAILSARGTYSMQLAVNNLAVMTLNSSKNVGFGGITAPLSQIHIAAGSATANTAPLQLSSGPVETVARAGVMEFLTDTFYLTQTTSAARKKIALMNNNANVATDTFKVPVSNVSTVSISAKDSLGSVTVTGTSKLGTLGTAVDSVIMRDNVSGDTLYICIGAKKWAFVPVSDK